MLGRRQRRDLRFLFILPFGSHGLGLVRLRERERGGRGVISTAVCIVPKSFPDKDVSRGVVLVVSYGLCLDRSV